MSFKIYVKTRIKHFFPRVFSHIDLPANLAFITREITSGEQIKCPTLT